MGVTINKLLPKPTLQLVKKQKTEDVDIIYDYSQQRQYELGVKVFTFWFSRAISREEAEIFLAGQQLYIGHMIYKGIKTEANYYITDDRIIYTWESYTT